MARWWPSVYLDVREVDAGGDGGVGRELDVFTKGWLPYTLRWRLRVTEPLTDAGYAIAATGDLVGTGRWSFRTDGAVVHITYDWQVQASKPLLRRLGWLLKPPSRPTTTGASDSRSCAGALDQRPRLRSPHRRGPPS